MRLTGWWHRRNNPARIELYTRTSFHLFALNEITLLSSSVLSGGGTRNGLRLGLFALVAVHAALCATLCSTGLNWHLGRREQPIRLLAAVATTSLGGALFALGLRMNVPSAHGVGAPELAVALVSIGLGATVLAVPRGHAVLHLLIGAALALGTGSTLLGLPLQAGAGFALAVLVAGGAMVFASGSSLWLLRVVRELDSARELQSQLAVAEERLRFGRDLHDVMGRNLAVIALKSELAVQLARRGGPQAVEQMIEVQRIARQSQREVRDVVRGYRKADLAVELAGALSVLRAAGIDGRAEGQDGSALPDEVQAALGWVVREATTNVLRHSEARHCTIRLTVGADASAVLSVDNDGVREHTADGTSGSGLNGLSERLAALNGTLATDSRTGDFRLTAEVPPPGPRTQQLEVAAP
ncbi:sensor histidine kinase [Streptacidiphilus albus]|uniref:sensor histidine kinase n=1 Tax=Streptacidiphilus albus TaxID=105425 RepID=UPI00054B3C94|nr:histidine kinase [Streptacidiphilus albus]